MRRWVTRSPEETFAAGAEFAQTLRPDDVVALRGGLGAGKTQFVKGVCSRLAPGAEVVSPTFSLVLEYGGTPPVFHFDMYRIGSFEDLCSIGFYDYLDRGGVCLIEWSENVEPWLPEGRRTVELERLGETVREIREVTP